MHAAAIPDADPSTLKRPEDSARELVDAIASMLTPSNESFASASANVRNVECGQYQRCYRERCENATVSFSPGFSPG